jgi:hypothetical protein
MSNATFHHSAREIAARLAANPEAVCRHYLSNGRREGRYWIVGNVHNAPGRSMYVRLTGPSAGSGAAGKWTDAATGEHGDLLDIISISCNLDSFAETLHEASRFLALPMPFLQNANISESRSSDLPPGSTASARRLFAIAHPIAGTIAETYLRKRGITALHETGALRFHPHCYFRVHENAPLETGPAMLAAVTDLQGAIHGVQRTWLDPTSGDKAPIDHPRRAMGQLLGHGVRFGVADEIMAAGEGIETMLSLRCILPRLPVVAALSANHLAALLFPSTLRRLYVARDNDAAGAAALQKLADRASAGGVDVLALRPRMQDFNDDLRHFGDAEFWATVRIQLAPEDVARFRFPAESIGSR